MISLYNLNFNNNEHNINLNNENYFINTQKDEINSIKNQSYFSVKKPIISSKSEIEQSEYKIIKKSNQKELFYELDINSGFKTPAQFKNISFNQNLTSCYPLNSNLDLKKTNNLSLDKNINLHCLTKKIKTPSKTRLFSNNSKQEKKSIRNSSPLNLSNTKKIQIKNFSNTANNFNSKNRFNFNKENNLVFHNKIKKIDLNSKNQILDLKSQSYIKRFFKFKFRSTFIIFKTK